MAKMDVTTETAEPKRRHFLPHSSLQKESKNLPADYIQDHMEDEDLNRAIVSPPLKYAARINSFTTHKTIDKLERCAIASFCCKEASFMLMRIFTVRKTLFSVVRKRNCSY